MRESLMKQISTVWVMVSLLSVGGALYLVGRIDASESLQQSPIEVVYPEESAVRQHTVMTEDSGEGQLKSVPEPSEALVASRNGTRYYTPGCSGIGRINAENRIYFDTVEEAEAYGLTLAQACQ